MIFASRLRVRSSRVLGLDRLLETRQQLKQMSIGDVQLTSEYFSLLTSTRPVFLTLRYFCLILPSEINKDKKLDLTISFHLELISNSIDASL